MRGLDPRIHQSKKHFHDRMAGPSPAVTTTKDCSMNFGIAGRKAIVCASSRGLGYGCAMALAQEGCEVVINGRDEKRLAAAADEIAKATGAKIIPVAADVATPRGPEGAVRGLPRARHPGQQQCRSADARFPRIVARADHRGRGRQHGGRDRTDPESDRPDDREEVRPHRQHHLGHGEGAAGRARPVLGRARGTDGIPRRRGAFGRGVERDDQFHPARHLRHRPAALPTSKATPSARTFRTSRRAPTA